MTGIAKDLTVHLDDCPALRGAVECICGENFSVGQKVRHFDGSLGKVTRIEGNFISWKTCGNYRVSDKSALKDATNEKFRWRK